MYRKEWYRLSALVKLLFPFPGALPQAGIGRAFSTQENPELLLRAKGQADISMGRKPMYASQTPQKSCKPEPFLD
jgi:hypothetical protein